MQTLYCRSLLGQERPTQARLLNDSNEYKDDYSPLPMGSSVMTVKLECIICWRHPPTGVMQVGLKRPFTSPEGRNKREKISTAVLFKLHQ